VGRLSTVAHTKIPLEVAVGDILGSDRPLSIRGWARLPGSEPGPIRALVYCLAGGGCATPYFDLQVEGFDGYSMAEYFCDRGAVVVAFDHPGIGDSDPVADPFAITPSLVAKCHDRAVREVGERLAAGTLAPEVAAVVEPMVVGLGHSMGGLIAVVAQGLCQSFDALVVLGHSGTGMPEVLTEAELQVTTGMADVLEIEEKIQMLARVRFAVPSEVPRKQPGRGAFFADDVPKEVQQAFARAGVPLLFTCGLTAMIPNSAGTQAASIEVPVFLGFGDHDFTADRYRSMSLFRSASYSSVYLLAESGHCHNQASSRAQLWGRLLDWIGHLRDGEGPRSSAASIPPIDPPARLLSSQPVTS
jgi:pimeloyl-ACP methyl ester carboxylesterase